SARPLRLVHLAWAVLVLAGCVVLASIPGGHPPALILVPALLALGILGHELLVGLAWLVRRGRARCSVLWPAERVLIATLLGALAVESRHVRHRALRRTASGGW